MTYFSVDGLAWLYPVQIRRRANMTPSDISGMMMDRTWLNDVLGTFYSYDITLSVPMAHRDDYTAIYNVLTEPVDGHAFVLPYNQSTVAITARVEQVSDEQYYVGSDGRYWLAQTFTVTANHPTRSMTLGEALSRGLSPLPDVTEVSDGDGYVYTDGDWAQIVDADDIAY